MGRLHLAQRAAPSALRSSTSIPQQGQIIESVLDDVWVNLFTVFSLAGLTGPCYVTLRLVGDYVTEG
jgi:hypothetical protein